jgi:hypothetical protein
MVWQIRPTSLHPQTQALNTRDAIRVIPLRRKSNAQDPQPRQPSTGPTVYKPMTLPPMVTLHKQTTNPALPSRINQNTPAAPVVGNPTPARPLGPMTNTPNQVRK